MELSTPRFKALAVTAGFSLWFFIITSTVDIFSIELFVLFVGITISITQIFALKLSKGLEKFAIINTKIFLGALFIFVISLYGILFKILRIDLMRLRNNNDNSYWLNMDKLDSKRIHKQY